MVALDAAKAQAGLPVAGMQSCPSLALKGVISTSVHVLEWSHSLCVHYLSGCLTTCRIKAIMHVL